MTETLKCPDCSAPLEYPPGGGATMRCPYCNSTVILPGSGQTGPAPNPFQPTTGFVPMIGQAIELAEVIKQLRAGNKIEAIRLYRQHFGVDLATAKGAVEKYAVHHQIGVVAPAATFGATNAGEAGRLAAKVGCGAAGGVVGLTALIMFFVFFMIHRQAAHLKSVTFAPPAPMVLPPRAKKAQPVVPGIAHQVLEFGSEGIGAGKFDDARSIAIDGNGLIYVGEYSNGRIQVFDGQGKFVAAWSIGKDLSLLNLAADQHGTVYAIVPSHIYRYEGASGKLLGEVQNTVDDESLYFSDACCALDGDLYAIGSGHFIIDIDSDGKIKRTLDLNEKVGENISVTRLTVIGTGEIFAMDREKGIFKFAADGRYVNRFGAAGARRAGPGRLTSPQGIASDGKGRIYVSDSFRSIQIFDGDGGYIDSFGTNDVVFGLAISDQTEIYACFRNRHSVRKFVLDKP